MKLIFTQHLRTLASGNKANDAELDATWDKLQGALRSEMKKRGLWNAPPNYLGILGRTHWSQPGAFEELLSDCYIFNFVRRLAPLEALLATQENIEGVIFRNIRNFLFERQQRHDPLGSRVFRVVHTAIRKSLDATTLFVVQGGPKVSNETILASKSDPTLKPIPGVDLKPVVEPWVMELLPDLVVSRGKRLEKVINALCQYLVDLITQGIECFRFKDLIDSFKGTVRPAWTALWLGSEGEWAFEDGGNDVVQLVQQTQPDSGFEERDHFHQLLECMAEALARLEVTSGTRRYLECLWLFFQNHAAEGLRPSNDPLPTSDTLPAQCQIAILLNIPRYRLPELRAILGRLLEACRGSTSPRDPDNSSGSQSGHTP